MKDITQREKVEALILNSSNWLKHKNYQAIQSFCIDELLQFGIDPRKNIQRSLQDECGPDLTIKRVCTNYSFHDEFNLTPTEQTRAHLLISIYNYAVSLKVIRTVFSRPRSAGGLSNFKHPEGIYDSVTSENAFYAASNFIAQITYMLTLTLRDDLTKIELDRVNAQIEKSRQDRVRGGRVRGNKYRKAIPIAIEEAQILKARDPSATKDDVTTHILRDIAKYPEKYFVEPGDSPTCSTVRDKWLRNYQKKV
jgi:hypothetical protein